MLYRSKKTHPLLTLSALFWLGVGPYASAESVKAAIARTEQKIISGQVDVANDIAPLLQRLSATDSDSEAEKLIIAIADIGDSEGNSPAAVKVYLHEKAPPVLLELVKSRRNKDVRSEAMIRLRTLNADREIIRQAKEAGEADTGPDKGWMHGRAGMLRTWLEGDGSNHTDPRKLHPKDAQSEHAGLSYLREHGLNASVHNLINAAHQANVPALQALLQVGFDPNSGIGSSRAPLEELFVGCSADAPDDTSKSAQRLEGLALLLAHGADAKFIDPQGNTLLHSVAQFCVMPAEIKALLAAGTPLAHKNKQDFSALDIALTSGRWPVARTLIDAGARTSKKRIGEIFFEPPTDPEIVNLLRDAVSKKK
ncbi:hypothetical protein FNU76_01535 [Chitinimonas arctica]|uniref:Uncharacterized protein n=1 Tax=Chitinimonas arctica TaxID=2594795 RepID=A0A516SAG5_9NEIS|nr:hypothetical protein [Chitinimonas arctica]QDQ25142.1 hypothetical protein FNU76_01535 [Chitinimonas arctica]